MFSIPFKPQRLLGTFGNLELWSSERIEMAKLIFTNVIIVYRCVSPAGLLRDVDAGYMDCMRVFRTS